MINSELTAERWFRFSLFEQLGNVGSDVGRAIRWKEKGEAEYSYGAVLRMLQQMNYTIADPKNRGSQLREIVRMREILTDYFLGDNEYKSTPEFLQKYFDDFALASAIQRGR